MNVDPYRSMLVVLCIAITLVACGSDDAEGPQQAAGEDATGEEVADEPEPATDVPPGDAAGPLAGFDCGDGDRAVELDEGLARTFLCGTATATLTYAGGSEQLSGGSCNAGTDDFEVAFGTVLTTPGELVRPDSFGVYVAEAPGDGEYVTGAVTLVREGSFVALGEDGSELFDAAVTLEGGRSRGSVQVGSLTATFTCS